MKTTWKQTEAYLNETLGLCVHLRDWPDKRKLPLFLRQEFDFATTQILERPVLVVHASEQQKSPAGIRKQFDVLQGKFDGDLVYVRDQIDAYQRKRLIEQKVAFIVPGNQLYLPTFGMELREYFRQAKIPTDNLSPLAQATILFAIYHKHDLPIPMLRMAQLLDCSKMSISRSFSELETLDLATIEKDGRSRELQLTRTSKETWEFGTKFWRTPVRKRLRVSHDFPIPDRSRVAGQTALANRTDISKGAIQTIAIGPSVEKERRAELARFSIPDDESERSITVELWRYDPCPLSQDASVDPLSLYLSMQDIRDERVEAALDDLLKGMTC
jgi:hypothetical protein